MNKKQLTTSAKRYSYPILSIVCILVFAVGVEWRTQHIIRMQNSLSLAVSSRDYYSASEYAHTIWQEDPKHPTEYKRSEANFLVLANRPNLALIKYAALIQSGSATVYDYVAYARTLKSQGHKKDAMLVLSKAQSLFKDESWSQDVIRNAMAQLS